MTTPFVAAKSWDLYNIQSDETILLEPSGSNEQVALEFVDWNGDGPLLNRHCNVTLEQEPADILFYEEGKTGSGAFDSALDEKNTDGTYKRLVHNQIRTSFYNTYKNPFQIFGVEYVDFPISKTLRNLSGYFRMFSIPRNVFGEKIVPSSVKFYDNNLDDNVSIYDDGYQNLIAGVNLFSKVQEVRLMRNLIISGSASYDCPVFDGTNITVSKTESTFITVGFYAGNCKYTDFSTASVNDTAPVNIGFYTGSCRGPTLSDTASIDLGFYSASLSSSGVMDTLGMNVGYLYGSIDHFIVTDSAQINNGFYSGVVFNTVQSASAEDTSSMNILFYSGSIFDQITTFSGSNDTASVNILFYSGSISNTVTPTSGSDSASIFIGYYTGSIANVAVATPTQTEAMSTNIGFYTGTITTP